MAGSGDVAARPNVEYGDRQVAESNEILRSVVGSGVHGIAIEGTDDHDEMGVFIEPPDYVIGVRKSFDQYVSRTQPEGVRSGPGDIDLTVYSLRKYMRLALAGNPTILLPLYAPSTALSVFTVRGWQLRKLAPQIVSRQVGRRFLGYLDQQHERMLGGGKQNRVPKRPELVERFGFDVKYASHALRLSLQGIELMETGRLSLPMRENERVLCVQVKSGQVAAEDVHDLIRRNRERLAVLVDRDDSPLPPAPNLDAVNDWMIYAYESHWKKYE